MYGHKAAGTFLTCSAGHPTLKRWLGCLLRLPWSLQDLWHDFAKAQPYSDDITNLQNVLLLPGALFVFPSAASSD